MAKILGLFLERDLQQLHTFTLITRLSRPRRTFNSADVPLIFPDVSFFRQLAFRQNSQFHAVPKLLPNHEPRRLLLTARYSKRGNLFGGKTRAIKNLGSFESHLALTSSLQARLQIIHRYKSIYILYYFNFLRIQPKI